MEHTVNLSLQVVPVNTERAYPIIDEAIFAIGRSGVKHEVQPFATLMEGDLDTLLRAVLQAKDAALDAGAGELILNIQIHLKKGADVFLEEKTAKFSR